MATDPESWTALDAAKNHLNLKTSGDDTEVTEFVRRAERALFHRIGHVKVPDEPITEYRSGGRRTIRLEGTPIHQVVSITVRGVAVPAADLDTGSSGWYLVDEIDQKCGIIRHTDCFPSGFAKVSYLPGFDPVPEDIELATLELVRHLWKTQRGTIGGRPGLMGNAVDQPDMGPRGGEHTPAGFAFPRRVMELIAPHQKPIIR